MFVGGSPRRSDARRPFRAEILIVENDKAILESLVPILRLEGYAVTAVETGHKALQKCRLHPFDLALVNLRLSDMDGMDLIAIMHREKPGMVLVIFTGLPEEVAVHAMERGARGFLLKPADPGEILAMIERQLG